MRSKIKFISEMDYQYLTSLFSGYSNPRVQIGKLLREGKIIRIKKGLYIAGHESSDSFSSEILANLIYGPSYISLEYALSWHGLIPERVKTVASMTPKRKKHFVTPIGEFDYHYLSVEKYSVGMMQVPVGEGQRVALMATPEKALADKLAREEKLKTKKDLASYLFEDLRIDFTALAKFRLTHFHEVCRCYRHWNTTMAYAWLKEQK